MRRLPIILGLVLISGLVIHGIHEFLVTNEGIRFYSSRPARLLQVMLVGVAGGFVAYGIRRLSPASQRILKLWALGASGILLVVAAAFFGHLFHRLAVWGMQDGPGRFWLAAPLVALTVAAGMIWIEFRQVWRQAR